MQLQRVQKGMHAAPGRQVSTWVHAVKAEESARVGGLSSILPWVVYLVWHLRLISAYPHATLKPENREADL
jgi:hypothetical protein